MMKQTVTNVFSFLIFVESNFDIEREEGVKKRLQTTNCLLEAVHWNLRQNHVVKQMTNKTQMRNMILKRVMVKVLK